MLNLQVLFQQITRKNTADGRQLLSYAEVVILRLRQRSVM